MLKSINPATEELIQSYEIFSPEKVNEKITLAAEYFEKWKRTGFDERAKLMKNLAKVLRENIDEYAKTITSEMGKPIKDSKAEIEKCAAACEFYAENSEEFLRDQVIKTEAKKSYICYQPLGVILAIMPWNFPFWQVFRFAAPTVMAGNTCLLKHASNVSGCAIAIESAFIKAGFDKSLFASLLIPSDQVKDVIASPLVKAVTLTGSVKAGKEVAKTAGEYLKKTVLELGGSDPYLVLEDADLELAARTCAKSRLINNGQSCIAAKRFIVVEKVYDEFLTRFKEIFSKIKMGNPLEDNDIGPLASQKFVADLKTQIEKSTEKGVKIFIPEIKQPEVGAYFIPTILYDVVPGTPAHDEELFGPVASLIKARNTDDAIRIANDSIFGLGAAVFSKDIFKAETIARNHLESGSCFVNSFVKSDARLPFGGIKESGYGRELSFFGIREFVNIKTVSVA